MHKLLLLVFLSIILSTRAEAQFSRYIIRFKDKGSNPFTLSNPSQYLTQRAISRRTRYNIQVDSTDLPVTPRYIDSLRLSGNVSILNISKWLNQVLIKTTDAAALAKINAMPFVLTSSPIAPRLQNRGGGLDKLGKTDNIEGNNDLSPENLTDYYSYGRSNGQVKIHKGDFLHNHGFRGEGMHLAMLDAGFFNYLTLRTFDSIRQNNQILGTWDFVANEQSVNEDNSHGMLCLSTIAANIPGVFIGTSPKTSFYLYRTEDVASEYPVEEQNLAAGLERSDSLGVDLCSISLGYYEFDNPIFNYTYANLNGNITISARASDL
ncbi:MAG: S8 family serine peptidase, partial [Chitinophagaceae bacterium]